MPANVSEYSLLEKIDRRSSSPLRAPNPRGEQAERARHGDRIAPPQGRSRCEARPVITHSTQGGHNPSPDVDARRLALQVAAQERPGPRSPTPGRARPT